MSLLVYSLITGFLDKRKYGGSQLSDVQENIFVLFKLEKAGISTRTVEWLGYWIKGDVPVVCARWNSSWLRFETNSYFLWHKKKSKCVYEICS